ncbi:MAG TPA: 1-acyl-sn-glycerol-3-phosphate acyltransferase [Flavobacteriia bacterium]|nr:1-acyl-sn-glycerol-3-phosphate acyltransferase [Flavobacteriia bacterium]
MKKIIAYLLTIIYYLVFGFILLLFHPIQWLAFNLFGYKAHKKVVDVFNWFLVKALLILGVRVKFNNPYSIPENVPLIIVSNHQSMYDISPLSWYFRKHHPKFVSKIELGKGIPSVSYNLKHGGSVLIDRKNPKQAIPAMLNFAEYIEKNKYSVVIFPEGTRSKDGKPKRFSINGLKVLTENILSGFVVPVTINNSYKIVQNGLFPLGIGITMTIEVHQSLKIKEIDFETLFHKTEEAVKKAIV